MTNKQLEKAIEETLRHQKELMELLLSKCGKEEVILVKRLISDYEIITELLKDGEEAEGKDTNAVSNKGISQKEIEVIIIDYFRELGIPKNIKGYRYAKRAVELGINDSSILEQITKGLYPSIAKEFETKPSRVERAIRHAIEVAWSRGNVESCQKIFGYTVSSATGKPTNSEFIAAIVEYILINELS